MSRSMTHDDLDQQLAAIDAAEKAGDIELMARLAWEAIRSIDRMLLFLGYEPEPDD